jgi:hypothetical protein
MWYVPDFIIANSSRSAATPAWVCYGPTGTIYSNRQERGHWGATLVVIHMREEWCWCDS